MTEIGFAPAAGGPRAPEGDAWSPLLPWATVLLSRMSGPPPVGPHLQSMGFSERPPFWTSKPRDPGPHSAQGPGKVGLDGL